MEDNERHLYDKFDSLIARHRVLIDHLCMHRALGDVNRCAELRQDCYISLWHYLPKLREDANQFHETAWVVWHCRSVFSHLRYRRRTHRFLPLDENIANTLGEPDDSHLRDTIDSLSTFLTSHEQRAFYLMSDGYSAKEIARELGIKHRSAVLLRHRIIEKLKHAIVNNKKYPS
ncbi:MAG: sigma-70 family RNA polymerase sigma factor [Bacteroidales bacterium]|nr:sigma-70 family RNA polymerase sigma factor [Bacteroidales bacterium]